MTPKLVRLSLAVETVQWHQSRRESRHSCSKATDGLSLAGYLSVTMFWA